MDIGKFVEDKPPQPDEPEATGPEPAPAVPDAMSLIAAAAKGERTPPVEETAPIPRDELDDEPEAAGSYFDDEPATAGPEPAPAPTLAADQKPGLNKWAKRGGVAAAVLVALVVAGVSWRQYRLSGDTPAPKPTAAPQGSPTAAPIGGPPPSTAQPEPEPDVDGVVKPESATVNPKACTIGSTAPMSAFVDSLEHHDSAWVCVALYGDGTVLEITLPSPTVVTRLRVVCGFDGNVNGQDAWYRYRACDELLWYFDGIGDPVRQKCGGERKSCEISVADQTAPQGHLPKQPPVTRHIRLVVAHTMDVSNQAAVPTTTTTTDPLGGLLGGNEMLPGVPGGLTPTTSAAPSSAGPPAFAIGTIQVLGHPAG